MTIEVYWGSGSPFAWRVLLALEIKGLPYESKRLSFSEQELKSPEFLAINPRSKVPAIKDGSFTLRESVAILSYLEDKQPEPALFGKSAIQRAKIWCAIFETLNYLEPHILKFVGPIFFNRLAEKQPKVIFARETLEKELVNIERILSEQSYLVDNELSAADIVLFPDIQVLLRAANKPISDEVSGKLKNYEANYPALSAWCKKIEALPGYSKTYPPHWKEAG
jgi:glutathione S-transferase